LTIEGVRNMHRNLILGGMLAAALAGGGCANMSASQQSTLSGAGIGTAAGVAVGAITGEWAWAAAGAAIGAGAGYLTNVERERQAAAQQKAFDAGVQAGKQQAKQ
jgi:osmotically inducible lipoprotein OsmB